MKLLIVFLFWIMALSILNAQEYKHYHIKSLYDSDIDFDKVESVFVWMDSTVKEIPDVVFKCKNLKELCLSECAIKQIPPEIITLKKLRILNLSGNKLDSIPYQVFSLNKLTELWLYNNKITMLSNNINLLQKLKVLEVHGNNIKQLPNEINLPNLEKFDLGGNPINTFTSNIINLKKLSYLSIHSCNLNEFPLELLKASNLGMLFIGGNNIQDLPDTMKVLKSLSFLEISESKLKTIPKVVGKLPALLELELMRNEISYIDSLFDFGNVSSIYLHMNKLNNISPAFCKHKKLYSLNLSCNNLNEIPACLLQLPNLNDIDLRKNDDLNIKYEDIIIPLNSKLRRVLLTDRRIDEAKTIDVFNLEPRFLNPCNRIKTKN